MADISQLEVNGTTYDICDAMARDDKADIDHTILGHYNVADPNEDYAVVIGNGTGDAARSNAAIIGWDGVYRRYAPGMSASSTVADNTYYNVSEIYDGDGARRLILQVDDRSDGKQGVALRAQRLVSGTTIYNGFNARIASDGTRTIDFNDAAAWRDALGQWSSSFKIQASTADLTKANNNLSSNLYPNIIFTDQSGSKYSARLESVIQTDGKAGFFLYAKNYDTNGNDKGTKGIKLLMDKSGNTTYTVSDPANFCSAINVGTRSDKDQSSAISMATGTWTNICSLSLAAGAWVIFFTAHYAAGNTGIRIACLTTSSSGEPSASDRRFGSIQVPCCTGSFPTYVSGGRTVNLASTTTYYLRGYQNNGSALSTYGSINAIRIK